MDEAKQIEIIYDALHHAKEMIGLAYKPVGKSFCDGYKDITDDKIKEYFYTINDMCIELADRNIMNWQKEEQKGVVCWTN